MTSNLFTYSVLQFRPSQLSNECINIGLLLHFPNPQITEFVFPKRLQRLKAIFPEVDLKKINAYLKQIKQNANLVENFGADPLAILDEKVLKADDSSLFFSDLSTSLLYSSDTDKIVNDLYQEYLGLYESTTQRKRNINDAFLKRAFQKQMKQHPELEGKLNQNYKVQAARHTNINFDFAWQNGTLNLVKPVSFDLKDANRIQEKAIGMYGSLQLLRHAAQEQNLHFDLLIAEPSQQDLSSYFKNGLETIRQAEVPVNFVAVDRIQSYVDGVADCLLSKEF